MGAHKIVVWRFDLVVDVPIDVIHQKSQDLFEGDVACGKGTLVQLGVAECGLSIRQVTLGIGFEHFKRDPDL